MAYHYFMRLVGRGYVFAGTLIALEGVLSWLSIMFVTDASQQE